MKTDFEFDSDGTTLRGWLARPDTSQPVPTVLATHGLASTIEFLEPFADVLVAAGFGVAAFDHRSIGRSDGEPRQEVDPWRQVQDMRNAVTYLRNRPEVDRDAVGIWGASIGGGVAVTSAATDPRVAAVVGVALVASGWSASRIMTPEPERAGFELALDDDRRGRMTGAEAATVPLLPDLPDDELAASTDESVRFLYPKTKTAATFRPYVTLRSLEHIRDFEPVAFAHRMSPRPILLIVAADDQLAPVADARRMLDLIESPSKELTVIAGHHYAPLGERFEEMTAATVDFFRRNLVGAAAHSGIGAS